MICVTRSLLTSFLLGAVFAAGTVQAQLLLSDDFNDNSIDPAKWTVVTAGVPRGPAATETNQHMELVGRAHLVTTPDFDPALLGGIQIDGAWAFVSRGDFDMMQILTRSDGVPSSPYGETTHGLEFHWGTPGGGLSIHPRSPRIVTSNLQTSGPAVPVMGQAYRFRIIDAGPTATFTIFDTQWNTLATATVTIVSDNTTVKKIVFHNRENMMGRTLGFLDDVAIAIPNNTPAAYSTFGKGCAGANGTPQLAAMGLPALGGGFTLQMTNLPILRPGMLVFGLSDRSWTGATLPMNLGVLGMPGCTLYTDLATLVVSLPSRGTGTTDFPMGVPINPTLMGSTFFNQYFVVDLAVGPTPVISSNAGRAVIGY